VGQDEVDVVRSVDSVVVVVVPGLGDEIQAIKAGIMEIADIFVINKADRQGVERTERDLEMLLGMAEEVVEGWRPPVLRTVASRNEGIEELLAKMVEHCAWLHEGDRMQARRRSQLRLRVETILKERVLYIRKRLIAIFSLPHQLIANRITKGCKQHRESPHEQRFHTGQLNMTKVDDQHTDKNKN
jgi:LAO/AO transport system kinase